MTLNVWFGMNQSRTRGWHCWRLLKGNMDDPLLARCQHIQCSDSNRTDLGYETFAIHCVSADKRNGKC
jgi:hypothetical protein